MTIKRTILVILGIMAALVVAGTAILHLSSFQRGVAERVTAAIESKTCLKVEFQSFDYRLWPATLEVRGISVSDPLGRSLTIEAVDASWAWSQLIGGTPRLHHLAIEGLNADAFALPMPCPNDDDGGPEANPWNALAIDDLTITRGGVSGENSDLAFSWTGLEAQAMLVDQKLGLRLTAESLHLDRKERNLFVGPLELELQGSAKSIELKTLKITDGPIECEATGSAAGSGQEATAHVSGTVGLKEILHWWDPSIAALVNPEGPLGVVADIGWNTDSGLGAEARLDGRPIGLAGYTFSLLEATYVDGRLTGKAADPSWGRAEADLTPNALLEVRARLEGANPMPALRLGAIELPEGIPEDVGLSGNFQARMPLPLQLERITGTADLRARWKGGWAHLQGSADHGIEIDRAEVDIFGAKAEASGTFALDGTVDIKGAVQVPGPRDTIDRLSPVLPGFETLAVDGGPLSADFRLSGAVTAPRIDADIHWDTPEVESNRLETAFATVQGTADTIDWTATLEADGGRLHASGTASIRFATVAGNWRMEASDLGALQRNSVMADEPEIAGSITGSGNLRIDQNDWRVSALLEGREIHAQAVTIPHLMLEAEAGPNCVSIDSLTAEVLGGRVEGSGSLCPAGLDGEIQAVIRWIDLDPAVVFDAIPDPTRGQARTSHQLSAAAGDAQHPAPFSRLGVLNVLSSTPPRPSDRKPHRAQHLANLATKSGEKCGLTCQTVSAAAKSKPA